MFDSSMSDSPDDFEPLNEELNTEPDIAGYDPLDVPPDGDALPPDDGYSPPDGPRPTLGRALLVILLASVPLLAVLYLGHGLMGLPFPPFDLSNWLYQSGFGPWVSLTDALIDSTAVNAADLLRRTTQAQWILGGAAFLLWSLLVGTLFYLATQRRGRASLIVTLLFGLLFALPLIVAALASAGSSLPGGVAVAWLAGWGFVWALVIRYALGRLATLQRPHAPDAATIDGMDRRQFLLQFGAGAAALTAISGAAAAAVRGEDAIALQRTLPMISPELLEAQRELFGDFRRFAIVRSGEVEEGESNVLALGAEYPDRNYVSIWIGGRSPIIVYENLQSALDAYGTEENPAGAYFLDE